jgi:hypothetical protein
MIRFIHIFTMFVMATVAVITPASAIAQEERETRDVFRGEFQMKGDFSRDGAQLISRPPHGVDDYFKIMPGDNITHWETRFDSAQEILVDDWLLRVQLRSGSNSQTLLGTGEVRFTIDGTTYRGHVSVQEATCQSLRQPVERGLFEGCYKYEFKGTLRFVEVPADAAQI